MYIYIYIHIHIYVQIPTHTHTHTHTHTYIYIYIYIMVRVFANGSRDLGSIPSRAISLLNTALSYLPTPPLGQDMTQGHFFKAEFNRFEFRVFPSPRLVALLRLKNQSALLFTHSWRENNWIHTFPKGISAM